jgi:hypothetical protein
MRIYAPKVHLMQPICRISHNACILSQQSHTGRLPATAHVLLTRAVQGEVQVWEGPSEAVLKVGARRVGHQAGRQRQARHAQRLSNVETLQCKQIVHNEAAAAVPLLLSASDVAAALLLSNAAWQLQAQGPLAHRDTLLQV